MKRFSLRGFIIHTFLLFFFLIGLYINLNTYSYSYTNYCLNTLLISAAIWDVSNNICGGKFPPKPRKRTKTSLVVEVEAINSQDGTKKHAPLGGSSHLGYVVNNYDDCKSLNDQVVPLPNGIFMASEWR